MINNLNKMGINQQAIQSQDQSQLPEQTFNSIQSFLVETVEEVENKDELNNLENLQELSTFFRKKLSGLQKQEEEFNDNVQIVVENDEQ